MKHTPCAHSEKSGVAERLAGTRLPQAANQKRLYEKDCCSRYSADCLAVYSGSGKRVFLFEWNRQAGHRAKRVGGGESPRAVAERRAIAVIRGWPTERTFRWKSRRVPCRVGHQGWRNQGWCG